MKVDAGIIGGTGAGEKLLSLAGKGLHVPTRFGLLRGQLIEHSGKSLLLIARHAFLHKTPPHKVAYLAMAEGLSRLGARYCFSTAAVGSVRPDLEPGSFAVCSDFLDLTSRNQTRFDRTVEHTDFTYPLGRAAREALVGALQASGHPGATEAVYCCTNGPRYETPFEVQTYQKLGADVVGMTVASEAIAMREAGVDYACLAIVTNAAAGLGGELLSHQEVVEQMSRSADAVVPILFDAIERLP